MGETDNQIYTVYFCGENVSMIENICVTAASRNRIWTRRLFPDSKFRNVDECLKLIILTPGKNNFTSGEV